MAIIQLALKLEPNAIESLEAEGKQNQCKEEILSRTSETVEVAASWSQESTINSKARGCGSPRDKELERQLF